MKVRLPTIAVTELQRYAIGYHYDHMMKATHHHVRLLCMQRFEGLLGDVVYRYTEMLKGVFLTWFRENCGPDKWGSGVQYYTKYCTAITPKRVLEWCEDNRQQLLDLR